MEYSLVFGASGGIGKEFCKKLLEQNQKLIISGRSENKLELTKNELISLYPSAEILIYKINLESESERLGFFNFVESNFKRKTNEKAFKGSINILNKLGGKPSCVSSTKVTQS